MSHGGVSLAPVEDLADTTKMMTVAADLGGVQAARLRLLLLAFVSFMSVYAATKCAVLSLRSHTQHTRKKS